MSSKRAILVISFGTSQKDTRDKCIGGIENAIAAEFPDWEVRRAFTSRMIIKRILKETGTQIDYIDEALQRLADDGFDTVVVQPTHFIKGIEYDDVVRICGEYRDKFDALRVAEPLISDEASYDRLVDILENDIVPNIRTIAKDRCGVILMGHGSDHINNACYSEMALKIKLRGMDDVFLVTVEGFPSFDDLPKVMEGYKGKKVAMIPFMVVAGVHANEDMAGDDPDSLKCRLASAGYEPVPIMKGLAEYASIRRMFADKCGECIRSL